MGVLLLIVGAILMVVIYPTLKNNSNEFSVAHKKSSELGKKIDELEEKIDILSNNVEEVLHLLNQSQNNKQEIPSFSQNLRQRQVLDEYDEIMGAYERGEDIVEIAKRFNRGKGEIQLILNLKK
ncbi:MAG: hypothetical protein KGZ94_13935 [Clostridia bacterium]|jgi:uncharacterized membrane protein|nr:hypothetical protein [Clostridia bacterium]